MKRTINRRQLQRLVESKVDEAWYNNGKDFRNAACDAALGAALVGGCTGSALYNLDKDPNDNAPSTLRTEENYQDFCDERGLDPDNDESMVYFNDWCDQQGGSMDESRRYHNRYRALIEGIVRDELSKRLRRRI